jgi:ribosomal protein S18 acetylase RimI-like enzyme
MNVRRAQLVDRAIIRPLLEQLMPGRSDRGDAIWAEALQDERYAAWVAEDGGRLAGFVDVFLFPDVGHDRYIGVINNVVVDVRARGQGVGKRLVREVVEHCRRHDAVEVHVWTDRTNARAIGLYKKLGFEDRGVLLELAL